MSAATHDHRDHASEPGTGRWTVEHRQVLGDALAGVELDERDRRHLDWLASWDCPTVAATAALLRRGAGAAVDER